jgi:hypothetical protein
MAQRDATDLLAVLEEIWAQNADEPLDESAAEGLAYSELRAMRRGVGRGGSRAGP